MEKISFKIKEEDRVINTELEFEDETIIAKITTPVASSMQSNKTISDMLKSMLRLNENNEVILNKIIDNVDNEGVTNLITSSLEKIQLKKK